MKKLYSLEIRGKRKEWGFPLWADPKHVEDWRADGLVFNEILNSIPKWWVDMGFSVRLWCFFEDIFNFKNPFAS